MRINHIERRFDAIEKRPDRIETGLISLEKDMKNMSRVRDLTNNPLENNLVYKHHLKTFSQHNNPESVIE